MAQMRTLYGDHARFEETYFRLYNAENRSVMRIIIITF